MPDSHAHPEHHNDRALWLGKLIKDIKPDVVVNLGDQWDMPSLSSFDKGKGTFVGRNVLKDLQAGLDFSEKSIGTVKKGKKKLPRRVFIEGNHEHRIKKAINDNPELDGILSFQSLDLEQYYTDIVEYQGGTPGIIQIDGINYSHYFVSGVMGRPISGNYHGLSLITKNHSSCVCGHSHLADWATSTRPDGTRVHGLVAGCYQDYDSDWAGNICSQWWRGVVLLEDVDKGNFTPRFISLDAIRKEYEH